MAKEQKLILGILNLLGQSVDKVSDSRVKGGFDEKEEIIEKEIMEM